MCSSAGIECTVCHSRMKPDLFCGMSEQADSIAYLRNENKQGQTTTPLSPFHSFNNAIKKVVTEKVNYALKVNVDFFPRFFRNINIFLWELDWNIYHERMEKPDLLSHKLDCKLELVFLVSYLSCFSLLFLLHQTVRPFYKICWIMVFLFESILLWLHFEHFLHGNSCTISMIYIRNVV